MRLALLATLALLPSAAFAQAGSQTTLQAGLTKPSVQPAAFVRASAVEAPAAGVARTPQLHDVLKATLVSPETDVALAKGGTLSYNLAVDSSSKPVFTGPVLLHTVGRTLPADEVANSTADVTVSLTVDPQGLPQDIAVVHSAGETVDKGTIAAVSQYRFKPATMEDRPTLSHLILELKLQK